MLPTTIDRFELKNWLARKKATIPKEVTQSHFSSWRCSITYGKTGSLNLGSTQVASCTPCGLFTRLNSFRLPRLHRWVTHLLSSLWFVRRYEKIAWWMVRSKRGGFLLAGIHKLSVRWGKCTISDGAYFE